MGLLDTLGKFAANTPAGLVADAVGQVLDRVLPQDPATRQAAALEVMKLQAAGTFEQRADLQRDVAQIGVNQTEAASAGFWRGGWRPFIGWTCGGALFSQFIVRPWVEWTCALLGHEVPKIPGIDDHLWELLGAMLGTGAMRTVEKIKGLS